MNPITKTAAPSHSIDIFIAGDAREARRIVQAYCNDVGFCVSVTKTTFVYTGGQETGVRVGIINYPRFTMDADELKSRALALATKLIEDLGQLSATVQTPMETIWLSRR